MHFSPMPFHSSLYPRLCSVKGIQSQRNVFCKSRNFVSFVAQVAPRSSMFCFVASECSLLKQHISLFSHGAKTTTCDKSRLYLHEESFNRFTTTIWNRLVNGMEQSQNVNILTFTVTCFLNQIHLFLCWYSFAQTHHWLRSGKN